MAGGGPGGGGVGGEGAREGGEVGGVFPGSELICFFVCKRTLFGDGLRRNQRSTLN